MGDKYGRKFTMIVCNLMAVIFGYLSSFSSSSDSFIVARVFVAISIGIQISVTLPQLDEVSYKGYQQINQVIQNICFTLGSTILVIISFFFLQSIDQGDWRSIIRVSNIVSILGVIFSSL